MHLSVSVCERQSDILGVIPQAPFTLLTAGLEFIKSSRFPVH